MAVFYCQQVYNSLKLLYYSSKYIVPKDWDKYNVICSKTKLLKEIMFAE